MPVVPNTLERTVFLRLNQAPAPILDFVGALVLRAALTAIELGVLDALAVGPRTANEVAAHAGTDQRGTRLLLDALATAGYVRERDGGYQLTATTAKWLPLLRDGVPFFGRMLREWDHLSECVRDPLSWTDDKSTWTDDDWTVFQNGMLAFARLSVDEVVAKTAIPDDARRLVDLGGGHGLYAVEFAKAHPRLHSVVFDVAAASAAAQRQIADAGLGDRVSFQAGNFWRDDIGTGHDVVFLANVVHGHSPEENGKLFELVARALRPGGRLVVLEQLPGRQFGNVGPALAALMAVNMYLSAETQTYPAAEIEGWLRQTGFVDITVKHLRRAPGLGLVAGRRPR